MSGKVNICAGVNRRFAAYVKWRGSRKWELIGRESRSQSATARRLINAMTAWRYRTGKLVLMSDWYDPVVLLTVRKP
jgi:hypothetical protein